MVSYVHIYQALFVTVDFGYALGVIRPDFGVIIQLLNQAESTEKIQKGCKCNLIPLSDSLLAGGRIP